MSLRRAFHSGVIACAASLIGGNIASQLPAQTWNPEVFGPGEQARAAEAAIREGIEPVATIGVPEGLHFRAQIAWMQPSSLAVPPPEWLVVNVVAVGAGAEDMVNYGHLRVGRVHTDTGEWLRMTEMAPDPYRMFIRIRRDPHSLHPEKAIWIPIRFRRPNKRVGSIPELEMQVVMNRAVASREIVIQDVESFVQDRPRDADLRQLRVRLKPVRVHYENGFRWDLDCLYDPDRLIRRLVLVDETGDEVQFGFSTPHGLTWQHWVLSGDNWPADEIGRAHV